jgi:hypothetical protein
MINKYGAVVGMRIGSGNRSTRRTGALLPLCPPDLESNIKLDLKLDLRIYTGFLWSRMRFGDWLCEHGKELLGSIKAGNLLTN